MTEMKYQTVIPYEVFSSDCVVDGTEAKAFVLPIRFTQPTQDKVVGYVRKKAGELVGASRIVVPEGVQRTDKSELELLIMKLPNEIMLGIANGGEGLIGFLKERAASGLEKDGSSDQRLRVKYGTVPVMVLEGNTKARTITTSEWYHAALLNRNLLADGFGEQLALEFRLQSGALPDRSDIGVLLKHRTYGSGNFSVSPQNYSLEDVRNVVDFVYESFAKPEEIARIRDVSESMLKGRAARIVADLHGAIIATVAEEEAKRTGKGIGISHVRA